MTHKKKKLIKYTPLLLALLSSSVINYAYAAWLNSKDTTMTEAKTDYWTYDYAIELMKKSANISYGIQDRHLFEKILAQKDKGDPNALFVYAYLLRNYNVVNERVKLSLEEADIIAFNIYWDLSEQGHPHACDQLLRFAKKDALKYRKITKEELLKKQKTCSNIALKHDLTNFIYYGNIFAFGNEYENGLSLLLKESENLTNKAELEKAIDIYTLGTKYNGEGYYIGRIAEAYYEGIGVKKDKIKAAAWAKLMTKRTPNSSVYKVIAYIYKINEQFEQDPEIQNSSEFKALYQTLKETIPMSPYAKKADK